MLSLPMFAFKLAVFGKEDNHDLLPGGLKIAMFQQPSHIAI
jgi:hypothetical protein